MQPPSNIVQKQLWKGITLSAFLHLSFFIPFIIIAFPILHFVKELAPSEESKAPSSLDEVDAMMVDILIFSEDEPESLMPSKFLGLNGTRQTLDFESSAPDSVPRTDLVETLEPEKKAEKETAAKEELDGDAKALLKKSVEAQTKQAQAEQTQAEQAQTEQTQAERAQAERAQTEQTQAERAQAERAQAERAQTEQTQAERAQTETFMKAIVQKEKKARDVTKPSQTQIETATAIKKTDLSRKEPMKATDGTTSEPVETIASRPPLAASEEHSHIPDSDSATTAPKAAHPNSKKTEKPKGPLGELMQALRERDSRLDRALQDAHEEELDKFQVQRSLRLQDAAAQGYAYAQYSLAEILMRGTPGEIPEEAKKLLTRAAKSGYAPAQILLSYLSASDKSEKRDMAEALAWMQLAAERGHKTALYGAKKLEKLMTIEEIIQARQRTQRYRHFETPIVSAVIGIDDERTPDEVLRDASAAGNAELVQIMLARGADPNSIDDSGRSALINAAWRGRKNTVELLLEKGADLTIRDREGLSAINWAGVNGHSEIIYLLGKSGANLNSRDNNNLTPLMRAAWNGHTKAVTALLSEGANPNLRTPSGKSALDFAKKEGYTTIQKILQKTAQP